MSKKQRLKDQVKKLELRLEATETHLNDLIDYLTHKDILEYDMSKMGNWKDKLISIRNKKAKEKEIAHAKELLKRTGYFVLKDKNDLDAARLEKWLAGKDAEFQDMLQVKLNK